MKTKLNLKEKTPKVIDLLDSREYIDALVTFHICKHGCSPSIAASYALLDTLNYANSFETKKHWVLVDSSYLDSLKRGEKP